jgi:hypothetical protein
MVDYQRIKTILDQSVNGATFGAHGPFWRAQNRDQFVAHSVFGRKLIAVRPNGTFDPEESNLIKALEGRAPFGDDLNPPTPGALFPRMPFGFPPVPQVQIDEIREWINQGCLDQTPTPGAWIDSNAGGPPADASVHNSFWRDLDNWAMFQATPETQQDVGAFMNTVPLWLAFAADPAQEAAWDAAVKDAAVAAAISRLEERQRTTVVAHYGSPVPLLTLLDCFQRFGDDSLPDDPLRPVDLRHRMNGRSMWFFWTAFSDACSRLEAIANIPMTFWHGMIRALLVGLMNDGLFRGRFTVNGFPATPQGKIDLATHVKGLPDASLIAEARQRFVDSGIAV